MLKCVFFRFSFQPCGQLSAGLTCEFNVTFEPKINKDLEGEITFLSTNGAFALPIRCTTKKCDVSCCSTLSSLSRQIIDQIENSIVCIFLILFS